MAAKDLIVDDDYIRSMGDYFDKEGRRLEAALGAYLQCLSQVKDQAIPQGDTHDAIESFLSFATSLKGELTALSEVAKARSERFISQIDDTDQYLF